MSTSYDFGREAEQKAVDFLVNQGYALLATNYRFGHAEVDIIAGIDAFVVAVEVKARTSNHFGAPHSFVNAKKKRLVVRAMDHYIIKNQLSLEVRFDIMSMLKIDGKWEIEHLKDAFYPF